MKYINMGLTRKKIKKILKVFEMDYFPTPKGLRLESFLLVKGTTVPILHQPSTLVKSVSYGLLLY